MSKLGINTGSSPNDGQGDSLRVAMGKINHNFTEIYDTFGDGNTITSYASTAGISTLAENLTGNPRINVSGILNTGITTTEHIEVRNITSTGIITAVQFIGDGSQISNVVAEWSGIDVLDDSVRKGVARELNFGDGLFVGPPDGRGRVLVALTTSVVSSGGTGGGGTPLEFRNQDVVLGEYSKLNFGKNLYAEANLLTGIVSVTTAPGGIDIPGISTFGNVVIGGATTTLYVNGDTRITGTLSIGSSTVVIDGNTNTLQVENIVTTGTITGAGFSQSLVGYATETYVDVAVSGIATFSGSYNDLTNKPTIPSIAGLASEGYVNSGLDLKANLSGSIFTGVSTFNNVIIGAPTSNVIPFLYAEYGNLPDPSTYHGAFAHVHGTNKAYFAHSAAWVELVNRNADTTVGTSTDNYLVGVLTATTLYGDGSNLTGLSTFSGDYNDLTNQPTIPVNITDLSDVNAGSPSTGQVLKWSGSEWTAAADLVGEGGAGIGLSDLSVTISAAGINSLTYNNATGVFNFTPTSLTGLATEGYVDSAVSGVATFSGDYNDLINKPTIPSISGLASEGYVDTQIGIRTFSGDYNDLTNQPSIPSIVGLASEGYVDSAVAGVSTFSGDYNDLTNKPSIPSIVGLASEGYVDTQIGIKTFSGNYNDLTNQPSIPSIAGLASEGYVDASVAGVNTFTGAATTITTTQIGNWDTAYSWGDHSTQGYLTSVAGAGGTWAVNASGIHTSKNVGIGTDISNSTLWVEGDGYFSGVVTATRFESASSGTPTIDSPNNLNINAVTVAISTDLTVGGSIVGGGQTIDSTGVQVTGVVTATSFVGDGSNLTGISFTETDTLATVTLRGNTTSDSITANYYENNSTTGDGSDRGYCIKYYVTANGTSAFRFAGPGLLNTTDNPTFYLQRGFTYIFENSTGTAHPFRIQFVGTTIGVGTYVSGSQTGTQYFTIPFDAPSSYEYQCTLHGGMLGTFNVA